MRRIATVALVLAVLAAGCGGGSDETATGVATRDGQLASKAEFIELADTICRNHQSRREDLESQASELGPLTSKEKARQITALLRQESANRRKEVEELRVQQPPPADAGRVASILSLVGAEVSVLERWADAYDRADAEAIRRLQIRLGLTAGRAADRARAYGFEVCGQQ